MYLLLDLVLLADVSPFAGTQQLTSPIECRIRDETMLELGVRLEDRGDESVWKLEDPAVLRREQQAKQQAAAEQKLKKLVMAHSKKQAVSPLAVIITTVAGIVQKGYRLSSVYKS